MLSSLGVFELVRKLGRPSLTISPMMPFKVSTSKANPRNAANRMRSLIISLSVFEIMGRRHSLDTRCAYGVSHSSPISKYLDGLLSLVSGSFIAFTPMFFQCATSGTDAAFAFSRGKSSRYPFGGIGNDKSIRSSRMLKLHQCSNYTAGEG
eukprot:IDg5435t1